MYGPPKIGKTHLASTIPNNIILDVEGGSGFHNAARIEKSELDSYDKFMGALEGLYTQEHPFNICTLDTIDWIETLLFEQAAKEHGKTSIADVGYGAGYATAQTLWKTVLSALDDLRVHKGIMIIMLAHEVITRYDNPLTESYDRYTMKLRNNDKGSSSASIIKEWADGILFVNKETFVTKKKEGLKEIKKAGTSERVFFHTQESPAYLAGNRFGLPATIPFDWPSLEAELNKAMTTQQEAA
jgi:hypothetical protein